MGKGHGGDEPDRGSTGWRSHEVDAAGLETRVGRRNPTIATPTEPLPPRGVPGGDSKFVDRSSECPDEEIIPVGALLFRDREPVRVEFHASDRV
jgi:hypothetical protein